MEVFAGLALGFFGSVHCVGMCGPIALILPAGGPGARRLIAGRLLYNLGRVVTYALLGLVLGSVGRQVVVAGLQQPLSIAVGAAMLLTLVLPAVARPLLARFSPLAALHGAVQRAFAALLRRRTMHSLLVIGLVNGLLPCGFVTVALAGAAATGSEGGGALFMAGFGLGTVPAMLGVSLLGGRMPEGVRRHVRAVMPLLTAIVAVLIVLRGMNLGIPYVSPALTAPAAQEHSVPACH